MSELHGVPQSGNSSADTKFDFDVCISTDPAQAFSDEPAWSCADDQGM